MYLNSQKSYKNDTLFMAAHIFDKYLLKKGHWKFPIREVVNLFTISILIASKMEQPIQPSYTRMISLLNKKEKEMVTRDSLIKMELEIITLFGCDFNFNCHGIFIDRYLRILGYHKNEMVKLMSYELSKFSLNEDLFLKYKPSVMAACSVILSINIFKKDECSLSSDGINR